MASAHAERNRWLFGPFSDLLLGCGLGYLAIFALLVATNVDGRNDAILFLSPFLVIFTGTPHYGATLLRVYEESSERRKYAFFAIWITALVWAFFYLGLYSVTVGSLLLTVYLSWSPWHYTGQNYGIGLMFLRRRGVEVTPALKRVIYASFLLSYVLALLALHGARNPDAEYAAVAPFQGGAFHLIRMGIASPWWETLFAGFGLAYLAATAAAAVLLLRRAPARDLIPTAALAATQMLWFSLPPFVRHFEIFGEGIAYDGTGAAYAFMWVAAGHTVQYLWITTYYAARERSHAERLVYLAKTLAAGSFIFSVPALIYTLSVEGTSLGGIARDIDVGVLLASAVNIHHFILDGAIWKLRDGRVARILIRRDAAEGTERAAPIEPEPRRRWLAPAVYALGAAATLAVVVSAWQKQAVLRPAVQRGDLAEALRALERLELLRHDEARDYRLVANLATALGDFPVALRAYRRSLDKHPSTHTYVAFGTLLYQAGNPMAAVQAYQHALELNPYDASALRNLGALWLQLDQPERAIEVLERAVAVAPNDGPARLTLERARKRAAGESLPPAADAEPQGGQSS